MDQYFDSALIKILLKNIINWISFLIIITSFFSKLFCTWKIMISKFFFFKAFTSIKIDLIVLKWIQKLDLLNLFCKYSYNSYFALIDWFINIFLKKIFLKLFLIDFFFQKNRFAILQRFRNLSVIKYIVSHSFDQFQINLKSVQCTKKNQLNYRCQFFFAVVNFNASIIWFNRINEEKSKKIFAELKMTS